MEPRSFLFVTWDGGGNLPPVLHLASQLLARGHRVRVLGEPCSRDAVEKSGATFLVFTKGFTRTDRAVDLIRDSKAAAFSIPVLDNVLIGPALSVAEETRAALRREATDVVVADFMMPGSLVAAEAEGVARVALVHQPEFLPGPGRPPAGLGLLPGTSSAARLRDRVLTALFRRILDRRLPSFNAVRAAFALPPMSTLGEAYHQADLRLIQTSRAFDAPISPAPANVRYVGPVLDDPVWTETEAAFRYAQDQRPLVVVSLSSTFQDQARVIARAIDALAGLDVHGLVTLGPAMARERFELPPNVTAVAAVPHSRVFPHAAAVVSHAGHGTVMRALAHGIPLVCLPMGRDQVDNAALVAHHGAGLKLPRGSGPRRIRAAIRRVLEEPGFAHHARSLQERIVHDAGGSTAIEELEGLAATARQSGSSCSPSWPRQYFR